jgi:hypothetical protein
VKHKKPPAPNTSAMSSGNMSGPPTAGAMGSQPTASSNAMAAPR